MSSQQRVASQGAREWKGHMMPDDCPSRMHMRTYAATQPPQARSPQDSVIVHAGGAATGEVDAEECEVEGEREGSDVADVDREVAAARGTRTG